MNINGSDDTSSHVLDGRGRLIVATNFWPARKGMYWWRAFELGEVREAFDRMRDTGLAFLRIFPSWEDFQEEPTKVSSKSLDRLVRVLDTAHEFGHQVGITLFAGHMGGMNWLPPWMLDVVHNRRAIPVFSRRDVRTNRLRNFYVEPEVIEAQTRLIREMAGACQGHEAIAYWDLGNRPSLLFDPPHGEYVRVWMEVMTQTLRHESGNVPLTLTLDQRDVLDGTSLEPGLVGRYCDFLSVDGSLERCGLAEDGMDARAIAFAALMTRWLGEKPVLVTNVGLPTESSDVPLRDEDLDRLTVPLVPEDEGALFYRRILELLHRHGGLGIVARSWSDFHLSLWRFPPFDSLVHERYCGIVDSEGNPKSGLHALAEFGSPAYKTVGDVEPWIDVPRSEFRDAPRFHAERLYERYMAQTEQSE